MAVHSNSLYKALLEAGVFEPGDDITRFVIDAKVGELVRIYVERVDAEPLETILPRELQGLTVEQVVETRPRPRRRKVSSS